MKTRSNPKYPVKQKFIHRGKWHQTEETKKRISDTMKLKYANGLLSHSRIKQATKMSFVLDVPEKKIRKKWHQNEVQKKRLSEVLKKRIAEGKWPSKDYSLATKLIFAVGAIIGKKSIRGNPVVHRTAEWRAAVSKRLKGISTGTQSLITRQKRSDAVAKQYVEGRMPRKNYCYKGVWMQSGLEVIFAQLIESAGYSWEYQPLAFKLSDGFNYVPDFRIVELNEYAEVKSQHDYAAHQDDADQKLSEFAAAGNVIHLMVWPFTLGFSETTKWQHGNSEAEKKISMET